MAVVKIGIPSKGNLPQLWSEIQPDFPMPSPRKHQAEALSVIKWALLNDDFDNIVLQAPTGIGKSAIAMSVQKWFKSCYLLAPSLGLTEQYKRDYNHALKEVRGRRNFPCWIREGNAHGAPCYPNGKQCPHAKRGDDCCPYYEQKYAAADARMTLTNPSYLFRVVQGDSNFDQREFAIIDEAHQLESFMLDLLEVNITSQDYRKVFGKISLPFHYHAVDYTDDMTRLHKGTQAGLIRAESAGDEDKIEQYRAILNKTSIIVELLKKPKSVIIENKRHRNGERYIHVRPVRVNQFASDRLESISKKRIFMSATILDVDTFLTNLGLENQRTLYVNVKESPFPKENFKIHFANCGPMSFAKRKFSIPRQIKAISAIMNRNTDKRGVVLPHSHAIREQIVEGLRELGHGDRIVTHGSDPRGRKVALDHFFNSNDSSLVLISTYVTEGFDFKGKLAEWLVICKIPYLPIKGDAVIEKRMEEDEHAWRAQYEGTPDCPYEEPNKYSGGLCSSFSCPQPCRSWYRLQTALKLVQGAGRIIRTPTDKGELFILDGSWTRYAMHNMGTLPSWFRNSIHEPPTWLVRHLK